MDLAAEFEQFWKAYPRKVGRFAAKAAYFKARQQGATQDELLAGVEAYIQHKPEYADYCHARTWLSQGRWMDEWEAVIERPAREYWADECQRIHDGACTKQWQHETRKQWDRSEQVS